RRRRRVRMAEMRSTALLVGLALLGTVAVAQARVYTVTFEGKGQRGLAVLGGKVYVVDPPTRADCYDWECTPRRENPFTIRVETPGGRYDGYYLTADPTTGALSLTKKEEPGSGWLVSLDDDGTRFRAAAGKFKGWYLSVEEKGEDKGRYTLYRLELTKKPG